MPLNSQTGNVEKLLLFNSFNSNSASVHVN